jgi:Transposase family tnp2
MKCRITFPRRVWRISPRRDPMSLHAMQTLFSVPIKNLMTLIGCHRSRDRKFNSCQLKSPLCMQCFRALSRFEPVKFVCCINSCVCYTGPYADLDKCPRCGTSRLNEFGRARRTFSYMPLIPRLRALMSNRTYATHLQYRADEHANARTPGKITDILDGLHYRSLLGERVVVGDRTYPHNYFSDHRGIALGFATDGFAPFKKRKHTAWFLLIFNYNLPPEQRFRKDNILYIGIIPGPKKPWDADSFIYPLVCELLELAIGVSAYDALSRSLFALHAYVITGFGDIPAVSMLMHMKGHNGLCPCRMCRILGIRIPDSRNKTLLRTAVPPQSSRANQWCHVSSRELTAALARSVYGGGQGSGVRVHRNTARGACKGVWDQGDPSSQCSRVPEVSPVVSVRLHAFDLGKSHPEPCPLLVRSLQGNG